MSAMDIDKPLDEIITKNGTNRRGRARRGGRGAARGGASIAPATARQRYAGAAPAARNAVAPAQPAAKAAAAEAFKAIISNLPIDVTEASIRELFVTTVGPIRECSLTYDSKGKSKGIATVIFKNKGDAQKTFDMYNSRMIDQRRPLKVEVVVDPSKVPLASRVAPLVVPAATQAARGGIARRGRGGRGGKAPATEARRPKKTAEQLDQEMLEYLDKGEKEKTT